MTAAKQLKFEYGPAEYGAELADFAALHFAPKDGYRGRVLVSARPIGGGDPVLQFACYADKLPEALAAYEIDPRRDYYITGNTFSGTHWRRDQLFALHNIVIDIDAHDGTINRRERCALLDKFVNRARAELRPLPASIVYTGRGVQFWYAVEPVSYKAERRYITVREDLIKSVWDLLQSCPEFAALKLDAGASNTTSNFYRLPYSCNTKTAAETPAGDPIRARVLRIHEERLNISREVKRITAARIRSKEDRKRGIYKYPRKHQETATERAAELFELQRIRRAAGVPAGEELRNNFTFSLYNVMAAGNVEHETIMAEVMRLNAGFAAPLRDREIINNLGSSRRRYERTGSGYPLSNKKIAELLGINEEERRQIRCACRPTTTKREREKLQRHAAKEARDAKILDLYQQGQTQTEIAAAVGCSIATAGRVIKAAGMRSPAAQLRANVCELQQQGHSPAEIADIIGVSVGTVYYHLREARKAGENTATEAEKAPAGVFIDRAAETATEATAAPQAAAIYEEGQSPAELPERVLVSAAREAGHQLPGSGQDPATNEAARTAAQPRHEHDTKKVFQSFSKTAPLPRRGEEAHGTPERIIIHPAAPQGIRERIDSRRPALTAEQNNQRRQIIDRMRRNREKWAALGLDPLPLPWPARIDPDRRRE